MIYCDYWAQCQLKKEIGLRCKKNCVRLLLRLNEDGPLKTEKRPLDRNFKWCENVTLANKKKLQNSNGKKYIYHIS